MRDLREFCLRLAAGLGLGVSAALLWEYAGASGAALCAPGGGCDAVKQSAYASVAGIPTPVFGVLFFAAALALAAVPGRRARTLLAVWSAAGAAVSAALLGVQGAVIGEFCIACVVTDASALAMLPLAVAGRRATDYPPLRRNLATAAAVLLALVPFGYGVVAGDASSAPPAPEEALVDELPPQIAAEQVDGKVTIVELIDFQCPYCQRLHHTLAEILPDYEDRVDVERIHVPIPSHQHAELAARTAVCAESEGLGDEMAHALMNTRQLGQQTIIALANQVGLSRDELDDCLRSEDTTAALEEGIATAKAIEVEGLPTYFIGRERYRGAQSADALRASIERAIERGDDNL